MSMNKPTKLPEYYQPSGVNFSASEVFVGGLIAGTLLTFAVLWLLGAL